MNRISVKQTGEHSWTACLADAPDFRATAGTPAFAVGALVIGYPQSLGIEVDIQPARRPRADEPIAREYRPVAEGGAPTSPADRLDAIRRTLVEAVGTGDWATVTGAGIRLATLARELRSAEGPDPDALSLAVIDQETS
jgi:hypothetical protein